MIPEHEVGCKICEKSIYRIFVEHIQLHLNNPLLAQEISKLSNANLEKDK